MTSQTATLTTERASTYLQQLCKHFAHKVEVLTRFGFRESFTLDWQAAA